MNGILERVNNVFKIVFNDENLVVTEKTCSDDIEGWDSLQHINLLAILEKEFHIEFDIDQIISFENVGDMIKAIDSMNGSI